MRVSRKNSNYMDKGKIVDAFNKSVSEYNTFCRLPDDDDSYERLSLLNNAGGTLYKCFEAAIKRTLVSHILAKYKKHEISWREYEAEKDSIEKYMNRDTLIARHNADNPERLCVNTIDFEIIRKNARHVTNAEKHELKNISKSSYEEVLPHVRNYLTTYMDPSAKLITTNPKDEPSSIQATKLFAETRYFDSNGAWRYVLLIDSVSDLSEAQRLALTLVKWVMVLDLDDKSDRTGLAAAFISRYQLQPGRFLLQRPERTEFNRFSNTPYWFYLNGLSGIPESLPDNTLRSWTQKYGNILPLAFGEYHKTFEERIRVIILSSDTAKVSRIAEALDSVYEDNVQFFLLSDNHPAFVEKYPNTKAFSMEAYEFARSVLANSSLFGADNTDYSCQMPDRDGTSVSIVSERFNHFELVHKNIDDEDAKNEVKMQSALFYQGVEPLSWYGAKNDFAISRDEVHKWLTDAIQERAGSYGTITIYHDPGIGGSTFARSFAYQLRKRQPICILRQYTKELTANQLNNLYKELHASITVFIDSSVLSSDQVSALENEIKPMAFPFVLIYMCRTKTGKDAKLSALNDSECQEMIKKLEPYASPTAMDLLRDIRNKHSRARERSPFFMSLYTFEENFVGVKAYISGFLQEMTVEQKEILAYLAIADKYANKPISEAFFPLSLIEREEENGEESMWGESTAFDSLVVLVNLGNQNVYRIRHYLLADEIIKAAVFRDQDGRDIASDAQASNLVATLENFIEYSKKNASVDYDTTLEIMRNLFIVRSGEELNKERFSPLINKVSSLCNDSRDGANRAGIIFKKLVRIYPDDGHFKGHLARFYSYVEENYDEGVKLASEAAVDTERYEGRTDPILFHIYGMSLKLRIQKDLSRRAMDCHERGQQQEEARWIEYIVSDADDALQAFEKSRSANNQDAGYQAAITLCIEVLDLAKKLSGLSETVDFIASDSAAWYMRYFDEAENLMRSWQSDDNISINRVQADINEFYGDRGSLERTVSMWQTALERANLDQAPQCRRLLARAKQRRASLLGYQNVPESEIDEIIDLAEMNIRHEPKNSANIRIWFDAIRHCTSKKPEMILDEAIDKLAVWKSSSSSIEAYYYYFICICIKAIEGSSRAQADIPILQRELKGKSGRRYDNRHIYEWLGVGKGLGRLKRLSAARMTPEEVLSLEVLTGYVVNYKNDSNASIRSNGMEVFFHPRRAKRALSFDGEGLRVCFSMGFSYDGPRAYDQSVEEAVADYSEPVEPSKSKPINIGDRVKCRVTRNDREYYVSVKLVDFHTQNGSIHVNDLGEEYSSEKRPPEGATFYARVIGPQIRGFWQVSLKNAAQESGDDLPEWKRKLREFEN